MQKHWKGLLYCLFLCFAVTQRGMAGTGSLTTEGEVVDDRGKPVEGAEIMVVPGRYEAMLSDSQGWFKMSWTPRSGRREDAVYYVVARHKAKNLGLVLPIAKNAGTLRLALKPGVSLSGRVVDLEGRSISGVRVSIRLHPFNWGSSIDTQNQSGETGEFKLNAIPVENRYHFLVRAEGYGRKEMVIDAGDAVNGRLHLGRIELPLANMSASGQVVDIHGHPVPGIDVHCFGEGQPFDHTKSDQKGYFELNGICPGFVHLMAESRVNDERISCLVLTEAGARDVKVVAREGGLERSYFVRTKSHEDIINSGNPFVAGRMVDDEGVAVAEVPVNVRCMQKKNERGQDTESYFQATQFGDVTDLQGRFAIELEEEATYSLLFSPNHHAAVIAYDVVTGTRDMEVILPNGGTITGQAVRFRHGERMPVPNARIELRQTSRLSYSHIGFDRDRETITDFDGRFRFEHIRTLMRSGRQKPVLGPRLWELHYGDTSQTVMFLPGETVKHLDLVIRPDLTRAISLKGKPMPDYTGINIDLDQDRFVGKRLLICFFDYAQRPARRCVLELNGRLGRLREEDIEVITVQASKTDGDALDQWIRKMNVSIPVGTVTGDIDETRFIWNVQSLPWLILTDREHIVIAEGFNVHELDDKMIELGQK